MNSLAYFVPPAFVNIQWKVYLVFGTFLAAMAVHFFLLFPETAGKTLEEVEDMFLSGTKAWHTHVEYNKARGMETGAVDPEKYGSVVQHRDDSDTTEVAEHVNELNGNKKGQTTAAAI